MDPNRIFSIKEKHEFDAAVISVFRFQYENNLVYREFCQHMGTKPSDINRVEDIPFLPIEFFRKKQLSCSSSKPELIFTSSGTTSSLPSKHFIADVGIYEHSFRKSFERFYGNPEDFCILALLPSYLERSGSSLVYMVRDLIELSRHPKSGFYLDNLHTLANHLQLLEEEKTKTLLIGVSFALMDLAERHPMELNNTVIMETGGMKGQRKELIREELHRYLSEAFHLEKVHSEYGMTELLSQAYSQGDGVFNSPPWMKVLIRDTEDPLSFIEPGKTGGVNIIDLANLYSCSFIATQDLGRLCPEGGFEILGRFDNADIRGCNLMVL
ncbi:acyl transferase [Muriicola soli]|uniref:Acyl transferase n=1 Tax=Muriicola soli TaxID=2507538 RepID=A0A411EC71_9FLAO|nr:acyl transferase [Muriicola soli]QBA65097.1 acyl transferase [Muriicola soli]